MSSDAPMVDPASGSYVPTLEEQLVLAQQENGALRQRVQQYEAALAHAEAARTAHAEAVAVPIAAAPAVALRTKSLKCKTPDAFKGQDVDGFLFRLNNYYALMGVNDDMDKVFFAASLLRDTADLWYRLLAVRAPDNIPFHSWAAMQDAMLKQFTPVNHVRRARDRLAELRQTTSVRRYIDTFSSLCLEIPDLHPSEQLYRFIHGLKPHVRRELDIRHPANLNDAMEMADSVDTVYFQSGRSFGPMLPRHPRPEPMELGNLNVNHRRPPAPPHPHHRLTPDDRRRLRDTNSCFYCRQPGHIMANCPVRPRKQLPGQGNGNGTDRRTR